MSKRKQFTPQQKVSMVRRHLIEKVPVSDLCDEYGIHATPYYNWQKQFFENAEPAFKRRPSKANQRRQEDAKDRVIAKRSVVFCHLTGCLKKTCCWGCQIYAIVGTCRCFRATGTSGHAALD